MIARCGGEARYFAITDMIYARQGEWMRAGDAAAVAEALKQIGVAAGLDRAAVDACLDDRDAALALVAEYQRNADADGIDATPTILINGQKHSNMRYAELAALIDAALAE